MKCLHPETTRYIYGSLTYNVHCYVIVTPPHCPPSRSPSPEPIYSHDGKRLNTRDVRARKKLEEERHELVQQATNLNPEYRPPVDYKYVDIVRKFTCSKIQDYVWATSNSDGVVSS